jgi:hypothetical protein
MKTMTKVVLGGAMLAGAVAAHASTTPVPLPSTDASELILVVHASGGSAYDLVLGETVGNGAGSYFNTTDATTGGAGAPVEGVSVGTVTGETGFTLSLSGDTALTTFLSGVSGQTITWGIYGGAYSGSTPTTRGVQGAATYVTTGTNATILPVSEATIANAGATDLTTDLKGLNGGSFDSFSGQANGYMTKVGTVNANFNFYGTGVAQGSAFGNTENLYGLTGNGAATGGQALAYLLGTVTFNGTSLSFTGIPASPVPIPAAGWLLGSGLLGMLGISRRRREARAA